MKRGIVLEREGRRAVVLAPDGTFRRVKTDGTEPGAEVRYGLAPRRLLAIAAVCLLLMAGGGAGAWAGVRQEQPVVYAVIDVNPAVEFTISRRGRVRSVRPMNKSGSVALSDGPDLKKDYEAAMRRYVERVVSLGYFDLMDELGKPAVLITVVSDEAALAQRVRERLYGVICRELAGYRVNSYVLTDVASFSEADVCREFGVSPGKLRLIRSLDLPVDEGKNLSIRELNERLMARHESELAAERESLSALCPVREALEEEFGLPQLTDEEKQACIAAYEAWRNSRDFRDRLAYLRGNWEAEHNAWESRAEEILRQYEAAA